MIGIIIITSVVLIIIIAIMKLRHNTLLSETYWTEKNKDLHTDLNKLLYESTEKLTDNNIDYFLIGGTLLGSFRDNKIIPWDDDIDIAVYHKPGQKNILIDKIKRIFNCDETMVLDFCDLSKQVKDIGFGLKIIDTKTGNFLDIFMFTNISKNKISFSHPMFRLAHPTMWITNDELVNENRCILGDMSYDCPSNTSNVIKRWFGNDALETGRITHVHDSNIIDRFIIRFFSFFKMDKIKK